MGYDASVPRAYVIREPADLRFGRAPRLRARGSATNPARTDSASTAAGEPREHGMVVDHDRDDLLSPALRFQGFQAPLH
jgi:hypothetical protein